MSYTYT